MANIIPIVGRCRHHSSALLRLGQSRLVMAAYLALATWTKTPKFPPPALTYQLPRYSFNHSLECSQVLSCTDERHDLD